MKRFVIKVAMRMLGDEVLEGYYDANGDLTASIEDARTFTAPELAKYLESIDWSAAVRMEIDSIVDEE